MTKVLLTDDKPLVKQQTLKAMIDSVKGLVQDEYLVIILGYFFLISV